MDQDYVKSNSSRGRLHRKQNGTKLDEHKITDIPDGQQVIDVPVDNQLPVIISRALFEFSRDIVRPGTLAVDILHENHKFSNEVCFRWGLDCVSHIQTIVTMFAAFVRSLTRLTQTGNGSGQGSPTVRDETKMAADLMTKYMKVFVDLVHVEMDVCQCMVFVCHTVDFRDDESRFRLLGECYGYMEKRLGRISARLASGPRQMADQLGRLMQERMWRHLEGNLVQLEKDVRLLKLDGSECRRKMRETCDQLEDDFKDGKYGCSDWLTIGSRKAKLRRHLKSIDQGLLTMRASYNAFKKTLQDNYQK